MKEIFSEHCYETILTLQHMAHVERDYRQLEAIDRALDTQVRNRKREIVPGLLCNWSMKAAYRTMDRRDAIFQQFYAPLLGRQAFHVDDQSRLYLELRDCLHRSSLNRRDKQILCMLMKDMDTAEIARVMEKSVPQVRVWASRARSRFQKEWGGKDGRYCK